MAPRLRSRSASMPDKSLRHLTIFFSTMRSAAAAMTSASVQATAEMMRAPAALP